MVKEESYQRILEARRLLDLFGEECEILEDLIWFNDKWLLILKLKNNGKHSDDFPEYTSWHIVIDQEYPNGEIYFYPSKNKGIRAIYPHQSAHRNDYKGAYYASNICLEQYSPDLKDKGNDDLKLYEYVSKALEWIERAANKSLLQAGDHFETVAFPNLNYSEQIIFNEDKETFLEWENITNSVGFCKIIYKEKENNPNFRNHYLKDFYEGLSGYGKKENKILTHSWGNYVTEEYSVERRAIWIKLVSMPKKEPWEAPSTWGELIRILNANGIDFNKDIGPYLNKFRNGQRYFLVIGFPIPEFFGEGNIEYTWQGVRLPILAHHNTPDHYFKGFRKNNRGFQHVDQKHNFNSNFIINWINSENWSSKDIISRGHLPKEIIDLNFLVIGVGAVGSRITESMVRMGVNNIDIVDPDFVLIGNLTRHGLLTTDLYRSKSESMIEKLSKSNIHFTGNYYHDGIEDFVRENSDKLEKYDVIIETTGENSVLKYLDGLSCDSKMYSISIGLDAKRIYIGSIDSRKEAFKDYLPTIQPWLDKDREEFTGEYPRDGIGCWHPLFPARLDHINILCNIAINIIEKDIIDNRDYITIVERDELGITNLVVRDEVT